MPLIGHLRNLILDLHASWILWLLIGLSIASFVSIAERALFFGTLKDDVGRLSRELDKLLRDRRYADAMALLKASRSPQAAVVLAGLEHADLGPTSAEKAMAGAMALERTKLERGLMFLGTLGNNAPFVGLLGTVIGVIEAFDSLARPSATGVPQAVGTGGIMSGISEALVATAVGLFVAIPAVAAYNWFTRRIQSILASTDALSNLLLAHLSAEEDLPAELDRRKPVPPVSLPVSKENA
jgi:biopolymer transport protein ExbB